MLQLNEYKTDPYCQNIAKIWQVIVCWFLCFYPFSTVFTCSEPKIVLKIKTKQFWVRKRLNQQTNSRQVSVYLKKTWSCLVSYEISCNSIGFEKFAKCCDLTIVFCFKGKGLSGRFTVPGLKPKKRKKKNPLTKKFDEDEVDYVPEKTARDEAK